MFRWLKSKSDIDNHYSRPSVMPPVAPVEVRDISEPVIKLLEMLKQDEWKFRRVPDLYMSFTLTHVHKKDVILLIGIGCLGDFYLCCNWMTKDEESSVNKLIGDIIVSNLKTEEAQRSSNARAQFAALIN